MFIDRVKVKVKAGNGGKGCVSFRREKFVPKGGPDGGDGGDGGSVIFRVEEGETTLIALHSQPYYEAGRGEHGQGKNCTGSKGEDIVCRVPPGTLVFDAETEQLLCDLTEPGQEFIVARGGKGGKGNARFSTSTNRAPRYAQPGEKGESRQLLVELKLIAQVGLVGFPNAGKSTLIRALTAARARVGDYPFTTLSPVLGTLQLSDQKKIIIADIPGLIEGAHEGAGLGTDFLRHVERTLLLVFVLDISDSAEPPPAEALRILRHELGQYRADLLRRRWMVALNKCDLLLPEEVECWKRDLGKFLQEVGESPDTPGCIISAMKAQGIEQLIELIRTEYHQIDEESMPPVESRRLIE